MVRAVCRHCVVPVLVLISALTVVVEGGTLVHGARMFSPSCGLSWRGGRSQSSSTLRLKGGDGEADNSAGTKEAGPQETRPPMAPKVVEEDGLTTVTQSFVTNKVLVPFSILGAEPRLSKGLRK